MNSTVRNVFAAGAGAAAALAIALPLLPADATTPATPTELRATLSGANEVPPADPNGSGTAFVFGAPSSPDKLCYVVFAARIGTPIAAHIHRGAAGVVGPVKVPCPRMTVTPFFLSRNSTPLTCLSTTASRRAPSAG